MSESTRILVVDDEPRALELVVRTLRKLGRVTTAASGDDALQRIETETFDIVISDQRMPGITGVDLLSRVAERGENCGRILLTGYADLDATIEAINRGRVHAYLHKPCSPDELRVSVLGVLARVHLAQENARLISVVTEQNSELQQALASLEQAQQRAMQRERLAAIGQMIAMIVHDLRTPIAIVRSAGAETLRLGREVASAEIVEVGNDVVAESDHMQRICSDLLEVTRASESGCVPIATELDAFVADALAHLIESASLQGVEVQLDLAAGIAVPLDADRMRRALRNLVQNALEAMPDGGLMRVESRRQGNAVRVSIVDSGSGIPDSVGDRVFDPFVTAGKVGGSGLGLAIVRKVIDDHRGAIAIGKPEGGGAAFHLTLPNAVTPAP